MLRLSAKKLKKYLISDRKMNYNYITKVEKNIIVNREGLRSVQLWSFTRVIFFNSGFVYTPLGMTYTPFALDGLLSLYDNRKGWGFLRENI